MASPPKKTQKKKRSPLVSKNGSFREDEAFEMARNKEAELEWQLVNDHKTARLVLHWEGTVYDVVKPRSHAFVEFITSAGFIEYQLKHSDIWKTPVIPKGAQLKRRADYK